MSMPEVAKSNQRSVARIMWLTTLALVPGLLVMIWQLGPGVLMNVITSCALALLTEALMLPLLYRSQLESPAEVKAATLRTLRDGSALLTGVLIGLAVPPLLPLWILALGVVFGMVFGKLIYGGLGKNLFNPAMVAWAMLILSFPLAMSHWPAPYTFQESDEELVDMNGGEGAKVGVDIASHGGLEAVTRAKMQLTTSQPDYDGLSRATPLESFKFRGALTSQEFYTQADNAESRNLYAWVWINTAFLAGGLLLLFLRIIPWVLPVGFLGGLLLLSLLYYDGGSSAGAGSPLLHLFSGATILAAFFILTDPVTSPAQFQGLLIFAAGAALITWFIRVAGAYPDGVAFAVLLMNGASPLIDHLVNRYRRGRQA